MQIVCADNTDWLMYTIFGWTSLSPKQNPPVNTQRSQCKMKKNIARSLGNKAGKIH